MLTLPFFDEAHRALDVRVQAFARDTLEPAMRDAEANPLAAGREAIRLYAAEGLLAVVLQHEVDHLEGRLFIDRLPWWRRQFLRMKGMRTGCV